MSMYFHCFVIIYLWKRAWAFYLTYSNKFPSPNDGLCQFSLYKIGSVVLEYIFLILSMYFHYFVIISP